MKVHGFEVTPEIEQACLAAMVGAFDHHNIWRMALSKGLDDVCASTLSARLIQRERKAGRIKRVGNRWELVEGK